MTSRPQAARTRKPPGERRAEILHTAARIALDEGLERITLRRVADELGVRPGLIGHYFPAADDLVSEAFAHAAVQERDVLLPPGANEADRSPTARLAGFLVRLTGSDCLDLSRLWLNARHLSRFKPGLRATVREQESLTRSALTGLVEDGVRRGEFRTGDPLGAALHILVTVDGLGAYANDHTDHTDGTDGTDADADHTDHTDGTDAATDGDSSDSKGDDVDHPALQDLALTVAEHRLGLTPGLLRAAAI
ncbi:TetR/AcrR family transcriptional regulator [Kitasatospora purpeofusca]|uniref:TetR/AcrR family transcriptional regulator n=1 Tax=Kitasatospora purpeofusca TaxID=67352 RepID=UPI003869C741|nr:TetR family transcriptional regulator [Kitasatospora purpeofusca]